MQDILHIHLLNYHYIHPKQKIKMTMQEIMKNFVPGGLAF